MNAQLRPPYSLSTTHAHPLRRRMLAVLVAACYAGSACANPVAPSVAAGQATFNQQGKLFSITNTPNTIINWQSFSIASDEVTRFIQQNADSKVLNRIAGQDPSQILGALQSNGKVFLINPNGVLFGKDSRVDVGGLVASTLNISNSDFLAGRNNFSGASTGTVSNQGAITTPGGGQVYLIAPTVDNKGVISAPNGDVLLAAGHSVQLVDSSNPDVQVVVSAPADQALNLGQIVAQGGRVGIYGALVNQRGTVNANSAVRGENGQIILKASGTTLVEAGSRTSATNSADGGKGGQIEVLGNQVGLTGDAVVDASGQGGGGTVLVGGSFQGKNSAVMNAQQTYVSTDAAIHADALGQGDGGKVVVWSDNATRMYGALSARGGAQGGNGGQIEASSHNYLDMQGTADTRAPMGTAGNLLLDPVNVYIANDASSAGLSSPSATPLSGGIFGEVSGTTDSLLTVSRLQTALGSGSVTVTTLSDVGAGSGNITVVNPLVWNNTNTLSLHAAAGNINLNANVTAATGTLSVTSDTGNIVQGANSSLLVGAVNMSANQITASGGISGTNASLQAAGDIALPGTSLSGAMSVSSTGGNITQNGTIVVPTLTVNAPGVSKSVTLTQPNSVGSASFQTAGAVTFTSDTVSLTDSAIGGALTLVSNVGGITLGGSAITTGGATSLTSAQSISSTASLTTGGDLTLTGSAISLGAPVSAGAHQVTFASSLANIDVGSSAASNGSTMALSESTLQEVQSSNLVTVNASGNLTVSGSLDLSSSLSGGTRDMMLKATSGVTVNTGASVHAPDVLTLQSIGGESSRVTNGGSVVAGQEVNIYANKLTLAGGSIQANSVSLSSNNSIDLGATGETVGTMSVSTAGLATITSGSLNVSVNPINEGGDLTISQPLAVTGNLSLSATRDVVVPSSVSVSGGFTLNGGNWSQNYASLPAFSAHSFTINGGTFVRVLGGNGEGSPYQIADVYGLQGLGTLNGSTNVILANDIDASGTANWNGGSGFVPLNMSGTFTGVFDGNHKTISGLVMTGSGFHAGLLTEADGGTIKDLTLSGGSVSGGSSTTGALVGMFDSGTIQNVHSTMAVSGMQEVGGLVGENGGQISASSAGGAVSGSSFGTVGGLVGFNNSSGTIERSAATGTVTGPGRAGGLMGSNSGSVTDAYATGAVSIVGGNGDSSAGGFAGANSGSITHAFSTGAVTGDMGALNGFVGFDSNGSYTGAYWDKDHSGLSSDASVSTGGLTAAQMQQQSNFSGFDFTDIWRIYNGHTQPMLKVLLTPITVTINNGADIVKTYDGQAVAYGGTVSGSLPDGIGGTVGYGGAVNAGSYSAQGLFSTIYDISYGGSPGSLVINQRPVTVTLTGNKVYDATTALPDSAYTFVFGNGNVVNGDQLSVHGSAALDNKNVGSGKVVSQGSSSLTGSSAANYTISSVSGTATVTKADLNLTGVSVSNRDYDGTATAQLSGSALVTPLLDDNVGLIGSLAGSYADKNVGVAKPITLSGVSLNGSDAGNYNLVLPALSSDINQRAFTTWTGGASSHNHLWSDPANWDGGIIPDGANVAQVRLPLNTGEQVIYDASAGTTSITSITNVAEVSNHQSLNVSGGQLTIGSTLSDSSNLSGNGGSLLLSGGTLVLNGTLGNNSTVTHTGGTLSGSGLITTGSYTISGGSGAVRTTTPTTFIQTGGSFGSSDANSTFAPTSFSQSGGAISTAGSVTIAQEGGALVVGNINATQGIILHTGNANGTITQSAGTGLTTNNLVVSASSGITLTNTGNHIYGLSADNTSGPISLVSHNENVDMPINHVITVGDISIESWGGFHTIAHDPDVSSSGKIDAGNAGMVSLIAHSPISINYLVNAHDISMNASSQVSFSASALVSAQHNISLLGGSGVSLNGLVSVLSGGSISAIAANGPVIAAGSINSNGGAISLQAPNGSVSAPASVFVGGVVPSILDGVAQAAAAASAAAAQAAADAAAKAAADAAAKAAADAAAKAAADAAAKAAADAAAKAAADAAAAAAAQAAADAAAKAAADAAAKAAADAAAKAAADAAAQAAADAAAKAAADAAAKAAADAAAKAAADAAAQAAAQAAAAKAAADAAAAAQAAAQNQQNQPVSQAINSTVSIINSSINAATDSTIRSGGNPVQSIASSSTLLASSSSGSSSSGGGSGGGTSGPAKTDDKKDDKKDDSKTDASSKDSLVKKDDATKKMYCN